MSFISQTGMGMGGNGNVASHSRTAPLPSDINGENLSVEFRNIFFVYSYIITFGTFEPSAENTQRSGNRKASTIWHAP